jgi:menaquinone-9 beta-reductase
MVSMISGHPSCDVFIVGGGPAGLAAAIALRQRGADVFVADALRPPIDKPCGEGLMPESHRALIQLGVHLEPHHGAEFTGITFASDQARVSADFPSGSGIGVRRTTLHRLLLDRASALGVRFSWNAPVVLNAHQPASVAGESLAYRWLIGADGTASRVRTWADLDSAHLRSRRFGFRAHYRICPRTTESESRHVEVHWGPLGQAYITPIGPEGICVSAMTRQEGVRLNQILAAIPTLRDRLRNATAITAERGALTLTRRLRRVTRDNIALIGDASGSVDAITGEGLALGFRQALLLADSLAAGNLTLYASRHAAILSLPQRMASVLLVLDRRPGLRNRTLRALAARPSLFRALLAVHVGELPLPTFLLRHGPEFGTLLLAPQLAA